jgi:hypothetical protein
MKSGPFSIALTDTKPLKAGGVWRKPDPLFICDRSGYQMLFSNIHWR